MGISIGDIWDKFKFVNDVAQKYHDAELNLTIADLIANLADVKVEFAQLREENIKLVREKQELLKARDIRSKLVFRDNAYYFTQPFEDYAEGPYCSACFDKNGLLIRINSRPERTDGIAVYSGAHWCPCCGNKW
jgi:hypothetical protein